jgi:hypothetical protein
MTSIADSAPRGTEKAAGTGERPAPALSPEHTPNRCAECLRLGRQLTAAHLSGDRSRMTDVRVMLRRHQDSVSGPGCAA